MELTYEERVQEFLAKLTHLSYELNICIKQEYPSNRPVLDEFEPDDHGAVYRLDDNGWLWF